MTDDRAELALIEAMEALKGDPEWRLVPAPNSHAQVVSRARRARAFQRACAGTTAAGLIVAGGLAINWLSADRPSITERPPAAPLAEASVAKEADVDQPRSDVAPGASRSATAPAARVTGMDWFAIEVDTAEEIEHFVGKSAAEYSADPPPWAQAVVPLPARQDDVLRLLEGAGLSGLRATPERTGFAAFERPAKSKTEPSTTFECIRGKLQNSVPVYGMDSTNDIKRVGPVAQPDGTAAMLLLGDNGDPQTDERIAVVVDKHGLVTTCETYRTSDVISDSTFTALVTEMATWKR